MSAEDLDQARRETDTALRQLAAANARVEELERSVDRLARRVLALEQEHARPSSGRTGGAGDDGLADADDSAARTLAARLLRPLSGDRRVE